MLNLGRLLDTKIEMLSRQVIIDVWDLGEDTAEDVSLRDLSVKEDI